MLLVASPNTMGGFFMKTVVLIVRHSERDGTVGFVLNMPTDHILSGAIEGAQSSPYMNDRLYMGGPVSPASVFALTDKKMPPGRSERVLGNIYSTNDVMGIIKDGSDIPHRLKVLSGFTGWAPGQLHAEIERGGWLITVPDEDDLFHDRDPESLWNKYLEKGGGNPAEKKGKNQDLP